MGLPETRLHNYNGSTQNNSALFKWSRFEIQIPECCIYKYFSLQQTVVSMHLQKIVDRTQCVSQRKLKSGENWRSYTTFMISVAYYKVCKVSLREFDIHHEK